MDADINMRLQEEDTETKVVEAAIGRLQIIAVNVMVDIGEVIVIGGGPLIPLTRAG